MEDCGDERDGRGLRPLQHSTSSASSSSARSLENPTPPYTPRSRRRSMETPAVLLPDAPALEEDVLEAQNWRETVTPQLLATLSAREADRQAVIYELLTTEVSHLRVLRVLDQVFFQKLRGVLSSDELACIFPNLPQVYELHANLCEAMRTRRDTPIVQGIGDIMLARFEGAEGEEFQDQASQLCSQQSQALDLIKNKKRKDPRFAHIIQECEANPHCRRLQLKDLLVSEMQRLTKYPLLLDNIIKHTEAGSSDLPPLHQAQACCRGILQFVNEVVRETEHRQRLSQYQRRLDAAPQFKSLDLTTKRMIHEGPLTWKVSKDKTLEIQALLLSDLLVLLQRGPDERLLLRGPSRWLGGGGGGGGSWDSKTSFSPVVPLDSLLVRPVATDNKALYVISTTERQIYELVAGSSSEKNTWKAFLEKTISLADGSSPSTNHRATPTSSSSLGSSSPISTGRHVYQSDDSMTEQTASVETDSAHDDSALTPTTPTDQSGSFLDGGGQTVGVAEAALHDVETLRRLIFRDLEEEDLWSHDSDGTPTNEAADEGSPLANGQRPGSSETILGFSPSQWEATTAGEGVDQPPEAEPQSVQVVRKALVAGSPSIPDDITDDVSLLSSQSPEPKDEAQGNNAQGNTFYLVMPSEHGESHTDELATSAQGCPTQEEEVMSSPVLPGEEDEEAEEMDVDSILPELDQSEPALMCGEDDAGQSRSGRQSHVIRNVDEIFHTIEELMGKLHQLRDMERAHHQLLNTLREPAANHEPEDLPRNQATVSRIPSLDRGSGEGTEGRTPEPPKIQSTGF